MLEEPGVAYVPAVKQSRDRRETYFEHERNVPSDMSQIFRIRIRQNLEHLSEL
jgi:hypothetical protein